MTHPHRATTRELLVRTLRTPLGSIVARPWFDRVALYAIGNWLFPLSRLWAAARAAEGSADRFFDETEITPTRRLETLVEQRLVRFETARRAMVGAEQAWERLFFGAATPSEDAAEDAEDARLSHRDAYNGLRRIFLPVRLAAEFQPVRWDTPTPEAVGVLYDPLLADPVPAFAPPEIMPRIRVSHRVRNRAGGQSYWLRFASPSSRMNDQVVARVNEPDNADTAPTLIFGHGICVEFDHWRGLVDEVEAMVGMGIRVVRPEAPWHGRRVPDGHYGGERFIAAAPLGPLDLFTSAAREWSVLIDWFRRTTTAPIAIGGSSLGAMTSQVVADKARHWPKRLQPDAMFLVTHCGRIEDAAIHGQLTRVWGIEEVTTARGWRRETVSRYLALLDAQEKPVVAPQNIVTVLGDHDIVTPYDSARQIVDQWGVPAENRFVSRRGHFSVPIGMMREPASIVRFREILDRLSD